MSTDTQRESILTLDTSALVSKMNETSFTKEYPKYYDEYMRRKNKQETIKKEKEC